MKPFEVRLLTGGDVELQVGGDIAGTKIASLILNRSFSKHFGCFFQQSSGLLQCPFRQVIVVPSERPAGSGEGGCSPEVEAGVTTGECPHIILHAARPTVSCHLVGTQLRVVWQAVGEGGRITQVMVIIKHCI